MSSTSNQSGDNGDVSGRDDNNDDDDDINYYYFIIMFNLFVTFMQSI